MALEEGGEQTPLLAAAGGDERGKGEVEIKNAGQDWKRSALLPCHFCSPRMDTIQESEGEKGRIRQKERAGMTNLASFSSWHWHSGPYFPT